MAQSFFLRAAIAIETIRGTLSPKQEATSRWAYQSLSQASPITHYSILRGTAKADRPVSQADNDWLDGNLGRDLLSGQGGRDVLQGGQGADTLYGRTGNDHLKGRAGRDRLYGGRGNDTLAGGNHNDHLWGGRGRDIFVLQPERRVDRIYDFNPSQDRLQIKGGLSFHDLSFKVKGSQTRIFYTPEGQAPQLLAILVGKFNLQQKHFVGLKPSEPTPNQSPTVASPLNQTATEDDATLQVDLLQGASDADGDTLSVEAVTLVSGDAVGVTVTGDRLTLDPSHYNHLAVGETEVIQYEYLISDSQGGQITQRVTITITGENDVPIAQPDDIQTTLAALAPVTLTGNVLNNNGSGQDTDPDGDTLQIVAVNGNPVGQVLTLASGASVVVEADGSFRYDFTDLDALKALGQAAFITDSVTYTLSDGNGGETTATATFRINGMNDAPIAQADNFSGTESTIIFGNLLNDNGSGADNDPDGDTLSITAINGTAITDLENGLALYLESGALLQVFGNGRFSYSQLGQLAEGAIASDQFTYTLSDGNGGTATATVSVSMTGENESPEAKDDTFTTNEATPISSNVLADNGNGVDSDADNDVLTVIAVNGEPTNLGQEITLDSGALLTLNADGSFDYDPNGKFEALTAGEVGNDSFTYWVSDGLIATEATVTLEIAGQNDIPSALALSVMEVGEDTAGAAIGEVSITDPDSTYSFTVDDARFEVVGGQLKLKTGVSLDFDDVAERTVPITITATEQNPPDPSAPQSLSQSFTITVRQTNQAPIAQNDIFTTDEATAISLNVFADNGNGVDSDPNTTDTLQVTQVNGVAIALNQPIALASGALLTLTATGQFSYDPNGKFDQLGAANSTTDSFTYTVSDNDGSTDTATVILTITGLNSLPNAIDDGFTVAENATLSGNVLADNGNGADSDPEGATLTVSAVNGAAASVGQAITLTSGALLTLNADGSFDYNPNGKFDALNGGQTGTDSFTYEVSDGAGGSRSATVTLTIAGRTDALSLSDLEQSGNGMGFVIYGAQTGAYSGFAVSMAGDVNQDGYADLLIGAPGTDGGSLPDTFTSDFVTASSATLSGSLFSIAAIAARDASGDNDGLIAIDAINGTSTSSSSPTVTLSSGAIVTIDYVSGKGTFGNFTYNPNNRFNLAAGQVATDSFTVTYRDDTEASGTTVSVEVAILGGADMGAAYVVYGKANDTAVNLSSLGSGGITFSSSIDNSQAGFALQGGQDINGDNIPDLIVGAPFATAESAYGVFNLTNNGNQLSLGLMASCSTTAVQKRATPSAWQT